MKALKKELWTELNDKVWSTLTKKHICVITSSIELYFNRPWILPNILTILHDVKENTQ